jgi:hypothetical protein
MRAMVMGATEDDLEGMFSSLWPHFSERDRRLGQSLHVDMAALGAAAPPSAGKPLPPWRGLAQRSEHIHDQSGRQRVASSEQTDRSRGAWVDPGIATGSSITSARGGSPHATAYTKAT